MGMINDKFEPGTELWVRCKNVSDGFHKNEKYIEVEVPGLKETINVFVSISQLKKDFVRALLLTCQANVARILFSGEVISYVNPVAIPKDSLAKIVI